MFGVSNVARWSQLDPDLVTADTARIAAAILWAESTVEDKFRGGEYAVPFVALDAVFPPALTNWMAQLAGVSLYTSRGIMDSPAGDSKDSNRVTVLERDAYKSINAVLAGQRKLQLAASSASAIRPGSPVGVPLAASPPAAFGGGW